MGIDSLIEKLKMNAQRPPSVNILPAPFAWIDVPPGQVRLTEGGYVPAGGQSITVSTFTIAKYPLTNAQFAKFVEANGYMEQHWWTDPGWAFIEKYHWTKPRYWINHQLENELDHPVSSVSWYEAMAYCKWLSETTGESVRLPTEQE